MQTQRFKQRKQANPLKSGEEAKTFGVETLEFRDVVFDDVVSDDNNNSSNTC